MPAITSPYNFVPLNENVFFPPWAPMVSHDVPFKNGLSGTIDLKITAESPIFIRGKEEPHQSNNKFKQYRFFKANDRYCIPGSSLRGEISSILEILSFSKLKTIDDVKYSQRDWNNKSIYKKTSFTNVKGGWLSKNNDGYLIEYNSKKPGRISHEEIDRYFGTNFVNLFKKEINEPDKKIKDKSSLFKHNLLQEKGLEYLKKINIENIENTNKYNINNESIEQGTIICTGQPSLVDNIVEDGVTITNIDGSTRKNSKFYEFIFWRADNQENLTEDDIRIKSFKTAYFDGTTSESIDWKFYKEKLKKGERIPVFITVENKSIKHFGLSMLYKLPYNKSIKDLLPPDHKKETFDMVDSIFGSITNKKLKSRVHFGHFFSNNAEEEKSTPYTTTLASPKPSFYPFYIDQNVGNNTELGNQNYKTYNEGPLAGRKRYPIHNVRRLLQDQDPTTTTTSFFPLKEQSVFTGTIGFHNLLPAELGALLSALTFHNQGNHYKHSIGQAKPLGFGKSALQISSIRLKDGTLLEDENKTNFINNKLGLFEKLMTTHKSDWLQSTQLKELFAMATPVSSTQEMEAHDTHLNYLQLQIGNGNNNNDFEEIKEERKALPRYSKFMGIDIKLKSLIDNKSVNGFYSIENIEKNLKSEKKNIKEALRCKIRKLENAIYTHKEEHKKKLNEIKKQQKEIEIQQNKERKKKEALETDLSVEINNITEIKNNTKLSKLIDNWKKNANENFIPEKDIPSLIKKLGEIYNRQSIKNKKKWGAPINQNFVFKKLEQWINDDKDKLKNILQQIINS